jgi:hypothetical protein
MMQYPVHGPLVPPAHASAVADEAEEGLRDPVACTAGRDGEDWA